MIKIGVAARFIYPVPGATTVGESSTYACLEHDMLAYLSRMGAVPVLIPPLPEAQLDFLLSEVSGVLLQGGADMAPESYGETSGQWPGDPFRDRFELKVMGMAMERSLPVLGICRGFQVMNVFFGGTLYQDLPSQYPQGHPHREPSDYHRHDHGIDFAAGGLLDTLYADQRNLKVNSVHHQGVKELGRGLEVEAHCREDRLIEAFSWMGAERGKVMGVQWHPEFTHHAAEGKIDPDRLLRFWLKMCE